MEEKLAQIWSENYLNSLPEIIRERGFNYSVNEESKDILITGINPSFRVGADNGNCRFDFRIIANDEKYDVYWSSLKKIVHDKDLNIDFRSITAYLDIFYFRETDQNFLRKQILKTPEGLSFAVDQIKLTQEIVETIIKPKLIIVKNRESAAYWGKFAEQGIFWMGYQLELLQTLESGELYKIVGLIDSEERVMPSLQKSNLENSLIFFTQHFRYASVAKKPNAKLVSEFLNIQSSLS